jgi:transcriptional regulator with XRE-family HTH domain
MHFDFPKMKEDHRVHYITIGENLRRLRLEKGYSQQVLSNKCDVERAKISRIETATADIKISTLLKIADTLEIDIVELIKKKF